MLAIARPLFNYLADDRTELVGQCNRKNDSYEKGCCLILVVVVFLLLGEVQWVKEEINGDVFRSDHVDY